jgi:hypothetical protein
MGRIPLYSYRVNCRISKRAGERLDQVLDRTVERWKKRPVGKLLSLVILTMEPEVWQEVLRRLPTNRFEKGRKTRRQKKMEPVKLARPVKNPTRSVPFGGV